jgi:hypothetical protein
MAAWRRMGTVADAKSAGRTATAAERASSTPRAGIDADRATAGPGASAADSRTTGHGTRFQLQLFRPRLEHALDGPGTSPKLFRRAAIRARRMLVLQRAARAATRIDSAAVEQPGRVLGTTPAAGVYIPKRREGGGPVIAWRVELLDGRAAPDVPDLHLRLSAVLNNDGEIVVLRRFRAISAITQKCDK